MEYDLIDTLINQWTAERPDLDSSSMAVVGRILRIANHLERRVNKALEPFGLALWSFDLLATLRRQGKPYSLTPTELMKCSMLSSGAMTNRIDRLEKMGFVQREPSPTDRRSLLVSLTKDGLTITDQAIAARLDEADEALNRTTKKHQKQLATMLRKLLIRLDD